MINKIQELCELAGIDFESFLKEIHFDLDIRVRKLLIPNKEWFDGDKTPKRYIEYLERITGHEWEPTQTLKYYKYVRYPSETREEIPPSLRYRVLQRDKSTCQKCGSKAPTIELHIDHKLPWALGGPTVMDNLHTLCSTCNEGKSCNYRELEVE